MNKPLILAVEDDTAVRNLITTTLETQDYRFHTAANGAQAILEAASQKPDIMLLDEPFSALDYQTRLNVSDDIGQIIKKEKKTAILVTHDLAEAVSLADRILVLTSRPATIGQTVNVSFSDPGLSPLARRNAPEFKTYFNLIWKELNPDE